MLELSVEFTVPSLASVAKGKQIWFHSFNTAYFLSLAGMKIIKQPKDTAERREQKNDVEEWLREQLLTS